jgi:hypothetical protein
MVESFFAPNWQPRGSLDATYPERPFSPGSPAKFFALCRLATAVGRGKALKPVNMP